MDTTQQIQSMLLQSRRFENEQHLLESFKKRNTKMTKKTKK